LRADASIWIYQFLNSMRDEDGNFIKYGHLLGVFRRICRLLFNRIRPVFVFDGATPALKRLTIAARRRRRELQASKVSGGL
jgi:DNA excision repair protein ERCC-5